MRKMMTLLVVGLLFGGCVSPALEKPTIDTTKQIEWWKNFDDKNLDNFEAIALKDNNSLLSKLYNYQIAKLNEEQSANAMLPSLSGSANAGEQRDLDRRDSFSKNFGTSLGVSYEADIFGQLRDAKSIKAFESQATMQDYLYARLALASEVAKQYFLIAYINENIALTAQNIAYKQKLVGMDSVRYSAGAISKLDMLSSKQSLVTLQSSLDDLERQKREAIDAFAILLGKIPQGYIANLPDSFHTIALPKIEKLDASVVGNRPDVAALELRLQEAFAKTELSRANFFPTFTLTGSVTTGANTLENIIKNPVGSLGLGLLLPFLNYNQNATNLKISKASYEALKATYQESLFRAYSDVFDALSANRAYSLKNSKLAEATTLAKEVERLSMIRDSVGAMSKIDLLSVQQSKINTEQSYLSNLYQLYSSRVDLYLATGGE